MKDVVKLQEENSSLKSGLQKLELSNTQQTKTLQVVLGHVCVSCVSMIICV